VVAVLTVCDAENLIKTAEIAAAMSLEALLGVSEAFGERIPKVRPHRRQHSPPVRVPSIVLL